VVRAHRSIELQKITFIKKTNYKSYVIEEGTSALLFDNKILLHPLSLGKVIKKLIVLSANLVKNCYKLDGESFFVLGYCLPSNEYELDINSVMSILTTYCLGNREFVNFLSVYKKKVELEISKHEKEIQKLKQNCLFFESLINQEKTSKLKLYYKHICREINEYYCNSL